jgi:membrane protein DedA with SNARE-associated domain
MLVAAGALAAIAGYPLVELIAAGVTGCLIADLAWYWTGKHLGGRVLGWLCKLSLSPDRCVRQTETMFLKVGKSSLLFAKFLPELSTVSVAMAGVDAMPLPAFLALDAIGALLFVTAAILLGFGFQDSITEILDTIAETGKWGVLSVLALLCVYPLGRNARKLCFQTSPKRQVPCGSAKRRRERASLSASVPQSGSVALAVRSSWAAHRRQRSRSGCKPDAARTTAPGSQPARDQR